MGVDQSHQEVPSDDTVNADFDLNELILVQTHAGFFPASIFEKPEAHDALIVIHWLNSYDSKGKPIHKRKWRHSHTDPRDGKNVFTNKPPRGFEPETGLIRRQNVVLRRLKLKRDCTFDAESSRKIIEVINANRA